MLYTFTGFITAALSWGVAFKGPFNFWLKIFLAGLIIFIFAVFDRNTLRVVRPRTEDIPAGVISGLVLYSTFALTALILRKFSPYLYLYVGSIKNLKEMLPWYITFPVSMFVSISEETFWRGFIQRRLMIMFGKLYGYLLTVLLYTLAHTTTFNPALVTAAFGAGMVWGFVFLWKKDLFPAMVSHMTWDVMLFMVGM